MAALKADWGVTPEQVVDVLALTGDTSDNIPGVPGIGLKTASKLLEEFGDLENLLANIDKVSGAKRKENLRDHAETARLARRLVVLLEDLPLELDWEALRTTAAGPQGPQVALHRVRVPSVPDRARRGGEARRGGLEERDPGRGHPRGVPGLRRRARAPAQVLPRHRDDRRRPAPRRPRRPLLLLGGGTGLLPAGPGPRRRHAAQPRRRPTGRPARLLDLERRSKGSAPP